MIAVLPMRPLIGASIFVYCKLSSAVSTAAVPALDLGRGLFQGRDALLQIGLADGPRGQRLVTLDFGLAKLAIGLLDLQVGPGLVEGRLERSVVDLEERAVPWSRRPRP